MLIFLAAFAYIIVIASLLTLCVIAAMGDKDIDRIMGQASSDPDFDVLVSMDSAPVPHERRH
jgi:hypothetical protein